MAKCNLLIPYSLIASGSDHDLNGKIYVYYLLLIQEYSARDLECDATHARSPSTMVGRVAVLKRRGAWMLRFSRCGNKGKLPRNRKRE